MKRTIGTLMFAFGMSISTASMAVPICDQYQAFYLSLPKDKAKYDQSNVISSTKQKYPNLDELVLYQMASYHDDLVECDSHWYCSVSSTHIGQAKHIKKMCEDGSLNQFLESKNL